VIKTVAKFKEKNQQFPIRYCGTKGKATLSSDSNSKLVPRLSVHRFLDNRRESQ
jgi:hypothetical protein